ncbi:MAG: GTP cyclohydrolase II, partial [Thiotrichaceae bacterium]|nr:GTP cyclohydrolase II [Thiotrichaceae bacterium]
MTVTLKFVESAKLPTQWAEFTICGFEDEQTGKEHIALVLGDVANGEPVDMRMH